LKVVFSENARRDRREAAAYYEGVSTRTRATFQQSLKAALQYLLTYPLGAPVRTGNVRAKVLAHFPYTIVYRVVGRTIFVLAIADQRRDPDFYAARFE
jgi:plasmid stabilization system protein ParE